MQGLRVLPVVSILLAASALAQETGPAATAGHRQNSAAGHATTYVILVSLDGFRFDYAKKYSATHLLALAAHGAGAPEGMIPAYPTQTVPDLYSIVTGLYPEHHGIVADAFYDPARKEIYRAADPKTSADGSWYGGDPLWSLAERQGIRSACLSWPGCQAKIAGEGPAYSLPREGSKLSDAQRVDQIRELLRLPESRRPRFIAVSFPKVDQAARKYGPGSPQTAAAVRHVDSLIGTLGDDLDALHLRIDLIVVSDHGMAAVEGGWADLDSYVPLGSFTTLGSLLYAPSEAAANEVYQKLKAADARFMVYRRTKLPAELHFSSNPRAGDPVIIARGPYAIRAAAGAESQPEKGQAGFDPFIMPEMRGIFYAAGPDFRRGITLLPFESVNVYPLIAEILGLKSPRTDGNADILSGILMPASPQ